MRKTFPLLLIMILALPGLSQMPCAPDTTMDHSHNYPGTWNSGCVGVPYEETVYFAFPLDSNVGGIPVTFISFELIGDDLPNGLTLSCNLASCKWEPSTTTVTDDHMLACIKIEGIPTATFNGVVTFDIEGVGKAFGITQTKTEYAYFNLKIYTPSTPGFSHSILGTTATFTNTTTHGTSPAFSYNWNFDDGNYSSTADPVHSYSQPGVYNVCMTLSNSCGDSTYCQTVTTDGVGVDPDFALASLDAGPVPADDFVHIKGVLEKENQFTVKVLDLSGKILRKYDVQVFGKQVSERLDVSQLAPGIYFLQMQSMNGFATRKIILR